ncbi:MAG: PhzF family phenazine biosynthesis protein [Chitinophagaceae bacterium]|nr:MAG: PhzF family phenazine biosynthesis protein [Chitinophagaceae bacterium]
MKFTIYQIDAFAERLFSGNPAAVVPLTEWLDESTMQDLAMENNLAETVFFVPSANADADFDIRWFTPEKEINLCGHATLASAFVLFNILGYDKPKIVFSSMSGPLVITRQGALISMDFPVIPVQLVNEYPAGLEEALGIHKIIGVYKGRDLLVEVASEQEVADARPDFGLIKKTGEKIILTAKGSTADFVSRFFAPTYGVDEDPVTGSAHSQLIPFWSEKLGLAKMKAKQLSKRGGVLQVEKLEGRVIMAGSCVFYMKGEFELP